MGSLMAGWSSNPLDAEAAMNRSKSSLTNEEIEAFWRSREKAMEEHLKDAAAQKVADQAESSGTGSAPIPIQGEQVVVEELNLPIAASPDWWTRSNWAFLNDPQNRIQMLDTNILLSLMLQQKPAILTIYTLSKQAPHQSCKVTPSPLQLLYKYCIGVIIKRHKTIAQSSGVWIQVLTLMG